MLIAQNKSGIDMHVSNRLLRHNFNCYNEIESGTSATSESPSISPFALHVISSHQIAVVCQRKHSSRVHCRYPAVSTFDRHKQLWPLHREGKPLELGTYLSTTQQTPYIMRVTSIVSAFALLFSAASALDKPLDIEVTKAVECTRKTKSGKHHPR